MFKSLPRVSQVIPQDKDRVIHTYMYIIIFLTRKWSYISTDIWFLFIYSSIQLIRNKLLK